MKSSQEKVAISAVALLFLYWHMAWASMVFLESLDHHLEEKTHILASTLHSVITQPKNGHNAKLHPFLGENIWPLLRSQLTRSHETNDEKLICVFQRGKFVVKPDDFQCKASSCKCKNNRPFLLLPYYADREQKKN